MVASCRDPTAVCTGVARQGEDAFGMPKCMFVFVGLVAPLRMKLDFTSALLCFCCSFAAFIVLLCPDLLLTQSFRTHSLPWHVTCFGIS